jgi:DNA (cytosine-5)-methyltransferase 1
MLNIIDLFSGAGGLTEGFRTPDFNIIAHVEMDKAACDTLKLRNAFYSLKHENKLNLYQSFLDGKTTFTDLINTTGAENTSSVIQETISSETMPSTLAKIDKMLGTKPVDGIIGGPPCQAFSIVGRKRNEEKKASDERIYLYKYYIQFLEHYNPNFFLFENVRGLLSFKDINGESLFNKMKAEFEAMNPAYDLQYQLINSAEYGVPQARQRLLIYGRKKTLPKIDFFKDFAKFKESPITIRELFQDLPKLHAGEVNNHYAGRPTKFVSTQLRKTALSLTLNEARNNQSRDLKIYKIAAMKRQQGVKLKYPDLPEQLKTHHNIHAFLDRFKALDYDGVSHTIVAHIAKDGHYYIHPDPEQNRSITVREAARIQTFPDDFYFMSSRTNAFKQIGNAVPPYLSKKLANVIATYKQNTNN